MATKGKLALRNKFPRIVGFNGNAIQMGPAGWLGADSPDNPQMTAEENEARRAIPSQDLELTDDHMKVLANDPEFAAMVQRGEIEVLNGDLEDILGKKAPPLKSNAADRVPGVLKDASAGPPKFTKAQG